MKTSKLLAVVFATVAIAGGVQFSTTNAADACPFSKKLTGNQSNGSITDPSGSFLGKIFPLKSDNAGIWTAAGTAGLFGLGALYLTLRGSEETAAVAVDAMGDLNEHPEAPGGEFDLPEEEVKTEQPEVVADDKTEKEIALV
jgi:hypothetical protein